MNDTYFKRVMKVFNLFFISSMRSWTLSKHVLMLSKRLFMLRFIVRMDSYNAWNPLKYCVDIVELSCIGTWGTLPSTCSSGMVRSTSSSSSASSSWSSLPYCHTPCTRWIFNFFIDFFFQKSDTIWDSNMIIGINRFHMLS